YRHIATCHGIEQGRMAPPSSRVPHRIVAPGLLGGRVATSFPAQSVPMLQLGVFIPIGNNGWLISTTSPQYLPSFELNRTVVQKAEQYGLDFALSMIKLLA